MHLKKNNNKTAQLAISVASATGGEVELIHSHAKAAKIFSRVHGEGLIFPCIFSRVKRGDGLQIPRCVISVGVSQLGRLSEDTALAAADRRRCVISGIVSEKQLPSSA